MSEENLCQEKPKNRSKVKSQKSLEINQTTRFGFLILDQSQVDLETRKLEASITLHSGGLAPSGRSPVPLSISRCATEFRRLELGLRHAQSLKTARFGCIIHEVSMGGIEFAFIQAN